LRFGVVVFPGSNCDHDTYFVLKNVLNQDTIYIWHKDQNFHNADCVVLPGGFSYGDYLRSGALAKFSPLMKELQEFADKGGLVLGICNGFQVLLELGLLPGAMLRNKNLKFLCQNVHLKIENTHTPFSNRGNSKRVLRIPIAHFDGNYFAPPELIEEIIQNDQIVFRYSDPSGRITKEANPNGSLENIAGLVNKTRNVLGMMPHPERVSESLLGSEDGRVIFESIIHHLKRS
jgi:phosphoribosylformylglycinamidine synthase